MTVVGRCRRKRAHRVQSPRTTTKTVKLMSRILTSGLAKSALSSILLKIGQILSRNNVRSAVKKTN